MQTNKKILTEVGYVTKAGLLAGIVLCAVLAMYQAMGACNLVASDTADNCRCQSNNSPCSNFLKDVNGFATLCKCDVAPTSKCVGQTVITSIQSLYISGTCGSGVCTGASLYSTGGNITVTHKVTRTCP